MAWALTAEAEVRLLCWFLSSEGLGGARAGLGPAPSAWGNDGAKPLTTTLTTEGFFPRLLRCLVRSSSPANLSALVPEG